MGEPPRRMNFRPARGAVEQRADEAFIGEDAGPFVEAQVGGHDVGTVLARRAEQVEPQPAASLLHGEVTELGERG